MAVLTAGNESGLNMKRLNFSVLNRGESYQQSGTSLVINYGNGVADKIEGSGFTYSGKGIMTGGKVTAYTETLYDSLVFTITGINLQASAIGSAAKTSSKSDDRTVIAKALNGSDSINGGINGDWLYGFNGNDTMNGGSGVDKLFGMAGNDRISGGLGTDLIVGGDGADTIIFNQAADSNSSSGNDHIVDFSATAGDRIDLTALDGNITIAGRQSLSFVSNDTSPAVGQYSIIRQSGSILVIANTGETAENDFFFSLTGNSIITQDAILV